MINVASPLSVSGETLMVIVWFSPTWISLAEMLIADAYLVTFKIPEIFAEL